MDRVTISNIEKCFILTHKQRKTVQKIISDQTFHPKDYLAIIRLFHRRYITQYTPVHELFKKLVARLKGFNSTNSLVWMRLIAVGRALGISDQDVQSIMSR